jgi:hypothetical protein
VLTGASFEQRSLHGRRLATVEAQRVTRRSLLALVRIGS